MTTKTGAILPVSRDASGWNVGDRRGLNDWDSSAHLNDIGAQSTPKLFRPEDMPHAAGPAGGPAPGITVPPQKPGRPVAPLDFSTRRPAQGELPGMEGAGVRTPEPKGPGLFEQKPEGTSRGHVAESIAKSGTALGQQASATLLLLKCEVARLHGPGASYEQIGGFATKV